MKAGPYENQLRGAFWAFLLCGAWSETLWMGVAALATGVTLVGLKIYRREQGREAS